VRLAPPLPAEPHRLMAPDDLAAELQMADMLDGELAPWHRGRDEDRDLSDPVAMFRDPDRDEDEDRESYGE
jgi:hypothetical protein